MYKKACKGIIIYYLFIMYHFIHQLMQANPLSMHGRSALDSVGMAYAREVYIRNEAELQGLSHVLVTTFHDASTKFVDKVRHCL